MEETVPSWPKLLSLAVHELRTPQTVVAGYVRMVLRDRSGPLAPAQRKMLEEAEKSCGRLHTLIGQMSEIGQLLDGRLSLSTDSTDLSAILREIGTTTSDADDQVRVVVREPEAALLVRGDQSRLRRVVEAVLHALRREIIDGSELIVDGSSRSKNGARVAWLAFGTPAVASTLREASADDLGPFDEWRGGCGLTLPLARLVVEMHGGRLLALTGERQKAGGVIELPLVGSPTSSLP